MNGECLLIENNCNNYHFTTYYTNENQNWKDNELADLTAKLEISGKVKLALEDSNLASPIDEEHKYQYFLVYLAYKFLID